MRGRGESGGGQQQLEGLEEESGALEEEERKRSIRSGSGDDLPSGWVRSMLGGSGWTSGGEGGRWGRR